MMSFRSFLVQQMALQWFSMMIAKMIGDLQKLMNQNGLSAQTTTVPWRCWIEEYVVNNLSISISQDVHHIYTPTHRLWIVPTDAAAGVSPFLVLHTVMKDLGTDVISA